MGKLKVAIIGCGRISVAYKKAFKELIGQNVIELKYCVDNKFDRAKEYAADFEGCVPLADYEELYDKGLDAVHIATPHYLHHTMAIGLLEHGINVLTEKPMAIDLQKADEMISVAKRTGMKLGVIFQTRYVKGCMEMKRIIESGALGKVLAARSYLSWNRSDEYYSESDWKGTWDKEGGGTLIDQAIHSMDRVLWLVGSEVKWVKGTTANKNHEIVHVEDTADALIQFENGALYHLYATNNYAYDAPIEIEIVCEKGRMGLKKDTAWIRPDGQAEYEISDSSDGVTVGMDYWGSSHGVQIMDFYNSIINNTPVFLDGKEGRRVLEVIRAIYLSGREGGKTVDFPFEDTPIN